MHSHVLGLVSWEGENVFCVSTILFEHVILFARPKFRHPIKTNSTCYASAVRGWGEGFTRVENKTSPSIIDSNTQTTRLKYTVGSVIYYYTFGTRVEPFERTRFREKRSCLFFCFLCTSQKDVNFIYAFKGLFFHRAYAL